MIKAIDTLYKGYKFRSRLEARWAVFFDALELEWEYEPEGFVVGDGINYLPDFRVTWNPGEQTHFVEIKPLGPISPDDLLKIALLSANNLPIDLIHGNPWATFLGYREGIELEYTISSPYDPYIGECVFVICRRCGKLGWESRCYHYDKYAYEEESVGAGYGICCSERIGIGNHGRLISAYTKARQARFEHIHFKAGM